MQTKSNLVLIGMPGAGKSTVGVVLAKLSGRNFVDTDLLIQVAQQCTLQEIVDRVGYAALREIEADILSELSVEQHVIATGGSAVYSHQAMQHLRVDGSLIYLDVPLAELSSRLGNFDTRGIARRPDQTIQDLFAERTELYRRYADVTITCRGQSPEQISEEILRQL